MIMIRCSRCGQTVPYDFENFIEVKGEPVCNKCFYGSSSMASYLNNLADKEPQEDK